MEGKQFHRRVHVVTTVLVLLLTAFTGLLWNLQVTNGAYYQSASTRKLTSRETVEAARGSLTDRYGQALVSNRAAYQVTLDTSLMGAEPERNANLLALIAVCRAQGQSWNDTLPISQTGPFTYTGESGSTLRAQLTKLLNKLPLKGLSGLSNPTATQVMSALRTYFEVDETLSDEDTRALVGILYEVNLRKKDVVQTEYIFAQDVNIDFISTVKEQQLVGIRIDVTTTRQYETDCAPHLLGRVGAIWSKEWEEYKALGYRMNDTVGKDGAEQAFESYLRGKAGVRSLELTTSGNIVSETWETEPEPGGNVALTLDLELQGKVEQVLADTIGRLESQDKEGGAIVVQDVSDGGVLAMASYPDFDLARVYTDADLYQQVSSDPLKPFWNRATQGTYSPGSTFKPLVGIAALEEGLTTPYETIQDTGYLLLPEEEKYPYGEYHPKCWYYRQYGSTHGRETLSDALRDSCNIFFYTVGHRLGIERINQYASLFGLGKTTGFELPESSRSMVAGPETSERLGQVWYGGDLLSASIGEGNTLCTPLQLTNYIATLVNGGKHYATHLLQRVTSNDDSRILYTYEPELLNTLNLDPDHVDAVKLGMWKVANDPESAISRYFRDLPVEAGAKTGTAQVASTVEADAVFVCFAPYDNPQIAISIVVERGGSGSALAPAAAEILRFYFGVDEVPAETEPAS